MYFCVVLAFVLANEKSNASMESAIHTKKGKAVKAIQYTFVYYKGMEQERPRPVLIPNLIAESLLFEPPLIKHLNVIRETIADIGIIIMHRTKT